MSDIFQRPVIEWWGIDHAFLSNFYEHPVQFMGKVWPTAEHAYQAQKCVHEEDYKKFLRKGMTPGQAKRLGRKVENRSDWDSIKLDMMLSVVEAKFSDPEMAELLLGTGDAIIIENNTWGDRYWGVCGGEGTNYLGLILMNVRDNLRKKNVLPHQEVV